MGDVTFKQSIEVVAGKSPSTANGSILQKDFEISPPEILNVNNFNESLSHRFVIEPTTIDVSLCLGTIALVKVLIFRPDSDIDVKIVNANGTSQNIVFAGGRTSIVHANLTEILVSNTTSTPIKGSFFVAGD